MNVMQISNHRVYSRILGMCQILTKKDTFYQKKGHLKFNHPLFKPFKKDFTRNILLLF